jgi:hypothetical protein
MVGGYQVALRKCERRKFFRNRLNAPPTRLYETVRDLPRRVSEQKEVEQRRIGSTACRRQTGVWSRSETSVHGCCRLRGIEATHRAVATDCPNFESTAQSATSRSSLPRGRCDTAWRSASAANARQAHAISSKAAGMPLRKGFRISNHRVSGDPPGSGQHHRARKRMTLALDVRKVQRLGSFDLHCTHELGDFVFKEDGCSQAGCR